MTNLENALMEAYKEDLIPASYLTETLCMINEFTIKNPFKKTPRTEIDANGNPEPFPGGYDFMMELLNALNPYIPHGFEKMTIYIAKDNGGQIYSDIDIKLSKYNTAGDDYNGDGYNALGYMYDQAHHTKDGRLRINKTIEKIAKKFYSTLSAEDKKDLTFKLDYVYNAQDSTVSPTMHVKHELYKKWWKGDK